jgi:hypothetical protein
MKAARRRVGGDGHRRRHGGRRRQTSSDSKRRRHGVTANIMKWRRRHRHQRAYRLPAGMNNANIGIENVEIMAKA